VTTPSTVRRFEFSAGPSNKYWEIWSVGREVTVRFGRIGTAGQTQVKSFPDAAAASKHVEKLVGDKVRKGYVAVS
jgi:predicted DNA-binding WGR domain protein